MAIHLWTASKWDDDARLAQYSRTVSLQKPMQNLATDLRRLIGLVDPEARNFKEPLVRGAKLIERIASTRLPYEHTGLGASLTYVLAKGRLYLMVHNLDGIEETLAETDKRLDEGGAGKAFYQASKEFLRGLKIGPFLPNTTVRDIGVSYVQGLNLAYQTLDILENRPANK